MVKYGHEDSLEIVKAMGRYLDEYKSFRDKIAQHLETTAIVDKDVFTSHGYDHCVRVLRALDIILGEDFYKDVEEEEVLLLCYSCLVHDVGMMLAPKDRARHAELAGKWILEQTEQIGKSNLGMIVKPWSTAQGKIIADIVSAHSDTRDESGLVLENTLEKIAGQKDTGKSGKVIRTGVLGALLRFGDELDCTSERTEDAQALVSGQLPGPTGDNHHWRRVELIVMIPPLLPGGHTILLRVDETKLIESNDRENDIERIAEVVKKLIDSLSNVNKTIFKPSAVGWWHAIRVLVDKPKDAGLSNQLSHLTRQTADQGNEGLPLSEAQGCSQSDTPLARSVSIDATREVGEPSPVVGFDDEQPANELKTKRTVDEHVEKLLHTWVLEKELLRDGHFEISPDRHVRDWIDTSKLLADREMVATIVASFIEFLRREGLTGPETVVIGEGFPGLVLASHIGFLGGLGASYVVPKREEKERADPDKELRVPNGTRVVLVTDAVAQGTTIQETLTVLAEKGINRDRVKRILTIFRRKPRGEEDRLPSDLADIICPLNSEFPMDLCQTQPNKCIKMKHRLVKVFNRAWINTEGGSK